MADSAPSEVPWIDSLVAYVRNNRPDQVKSIIEYTVKGRWPFPLDMLRYDEAKGKTETDRMLIELMSGLGYVTFDNGQRDEFSVSPINASKVAVFCSNVPM